MSLEVAFGPAQTDPVQSVVVGRQSAGRGELAVVPAVVPAPHVDIAPVLGQHCALRLSGELDACCADLVPAALGDVAVCRTVELETSGLTFMDVTGARALVRAARDIRARTGGGIVLAPVAPHIGEVLGLVAGGNPLTGRVELP